MTVPTDFKTLNKYYLLLLTSYQSFSMCLYDTATLRGGKSVGYGLDGYDLCRFIFPDAFFVTRPNPHHEQIKATWSNFFKLSDGESTFGIVSPFAMLEMFATIEERAGGRRLQNIPGLRDLHKLLEDLANGFKNPQEVVPEQQKTLNALYRIMKETEGVQKVVEEGDIFEKLRKLIGDKKIFPLEGIITKPQGTGQLLNFLSYGNQNNLNRALQYLNNKRGKDRYSYYNVFYNTLDVYHYVLFDNISIFLEGKKKEAYIASSGLLSRNSWFLTKYGKLPDVTTSIPDNWSARSADAPEYLTRALSRFRSDLSQTRDFFEESRALCRILLRDFLEIPEIVLSNSNMTERKRLLEENPPIKIQSKISQYIARLQNEYLRFLFPEYNINIVESDPGIADIDFSALYVWMTNPDTRSKEFKQIAEQVRRQTDSLKLRPLDWTMYIAPLGDTAYEILKSFDANFDI